MMNELRKALSEEAAVIDTQDRCKFGVHQGSTQLEGQGKARVQDACEVGKLALGAPKMATPWPSTTNPGTKAWKGVPQTLVLVILSLEEFPLEDH